MAASHPNVESIGGFELLGWLQTCVKEILQDRPSDSAIKITALIQNLRTNQNLIDAQSVVLLKKELQNLATPHVKNLLISIFGMFVSPKSDQVLRKNIAQIAKEVWNQSDDQIKYKIGTMLDGYRANFHSAYLKEGENFLDLVEGQPFKSLSAKIVALENLTDQLHEAHVGYNNFHHEPPIMAEIIRYFRNSADIPKELSPKLIKIIARCRLGRGLSYCDGVSPSASPMYDKFFSMLDDAGIVELLKVLYEPEINSKLQNGIRQKHLREVLTNLRGIAISDRLKESIDYLLKSPNLFVALSTKEFAALSSSLLSIK